ncbi:NAD(P)-binding protein [Mycena pura]|uniref:NAD(P)-binding protein n=1 Tax=Mycena pura TaxID=153505 RepID=A0AAD6V3A1_9AGAR|nr:NAD(P)-binding protein [Mycena pura]
MPTNYSAWVAVRKGHPADAIQLKTDLTIPTKLAKDHVLVKVLATALNPVGYKLLGFLPNFLAGRPHVMEQDVAGVIVDPNGSEFSTGDKVFGVSGSTTNGTLAQYVVLPAARLATMPPNISAVEAAGLATVIVTANQALRDLHVESGQTVFVNGGSSAVGLSAIQIAKSMGCKVVATASGRNKDLLLGSGVDEFIDYTQAPLVEQLKSNPPSPKFHAIFDAVGLTDPVLYLNSALYLAPGGKYVTAGTLPKTRKEFSGMLRQVFEGFLRPTWLGGVQRGYGAVTIKFEKKELETARDLVTKGAVKPIVDSVHPFDRDGVMRAYEKLMSKHAAGKVVIKVADEE